MGTVLIVEDDNDIRENLAEVLREEGFSVQVAPNGRAALDALSAIPDCSVILLDLMMPVMDGWEFRARQLEDPRLARIPVVVLSGAGNVEERRDQLGVEEALSKPFRLDALLHLVERYCPRGPN